MKKLTVFFVLFLCVSFTDVSAQTVRWELFGNAKLEIRVNGTLMVNSTSNNGGSFFAPPQSGPQYGEFTANSGDYVDIIAYDTTGNTSSIISPRITEDDPYMISRADEIDYIYTNEEHTAIHEYFTMPNEVPMYIGINCY